MLLFSRAWQNLFKHQWVLTAAGTESSAVQDAGALGGSEEQLPRAAPRRPLLHSWGGRAEGDEAVEAGGLPRLPAPLQRQLSEAGGLWQQQAEGGRPGLCLITNRCL